jgi:hypothetical protein
VRYALWCFAEVTSSYNKSRHKVIASFELLFHTKASIHSFHSSNYFARPQLTIMSAINRSVRAASRKLRAPALQSRTFAPLAFNCRANLAASQRTPSLKQFSTMSPLQSGAPPPPQAREYDPEIKDIASYVHNTPINSDLAVSLESRECSSRFS